MWKFDGWVVVQLSSCHLIVVLSRQPRFSLRPLNRFYFQWIVSDRPRRFTFQTSRRGVQSLLELDLERGQRGVTTATATTDQQKTYMSYSRAIIVWFPGQSSTGLSDRDLGPSYGRLSVSDRRVKASWIDGRLDTEYVDPVVHEGSPVILGCLTVYNH